jgi:hypothetical protein
MVRHRVAVGLAGALLVLGLLVGGSLWFQQQNQKQQQLEDLRWVLEQAAATQKAPSELTTKWEGLEYILAQVVERNGPNSDFATLADRAACTAWVEYLTAFGLTSDPPTFEGWIWQNEFYPPTSSLCLARMETSLDGSEWTPVMTASVALGEPEAGFIYTSSMDELFPEQVLTAGPHRVDFRAELAFFDSALADSVGTRMESGEDFEQDWPEVQGLEALHHDIRDLGSQTVNLFSSYPDDFPRAVDSHFSGSTRELGIKNIVLARIQLPEEHPDCLEFSWPPGKDRDSTFGEFLCFNDVGENSFPEVVGLALWGNWDRSDPIPVAGEASILLKDDPEQLVRFALAIGSNYQTVGGEVVSSIDGSASRDTANQSALPATAVQFQTVRSLPAEDGVYSGVLRVLPSRDLALRTKRFDSYWSEEILIPVEIEIATVEPEWVEE